MQGAFCLQLIKKILTIISWTYIFKLSIIYVFIEFETLASLRNIMKMNIHHILLALGKRKRNSLHTCWTEPQTIMIFMKCSWVPYNLCLSTAILKGVNIFCILWLATKHHQSKLDLYQPQSLKRVSLFLCCCYCQMTTHCKNLW